MFMQIFVCFDKGIAVHGVRVHGFEALIVSERPAHIMGHVSEIVIDPVNIKIRRILQGTGGLLLHDRDGGKADDEIQDKRQK
ncbi:hypothetical protein D1872_299610 [compost metagenome]